MCDSTPTEIGQLKSEGIIKYAESLELIVGFCQQFIAVFNNLERQIQIHFWNYGGGSITVWRGINLGSHGHGFGGHQYLEYGYGLRYIINWAMAESIDHNDLSMPTYDIKK